MCVKTRDRIQSLAYGELRALRRPRDLPGRSIVDPDFSVYLLARSLFLASPFAQTRISTPPLAPNSVENMSNLLVDRIDMRKLARRRGLPSGTSSVQSPSADTLVHIT